MLEERIAALEGGDHCVLAPSGLSAIALVDMALRAGDELLIPHNAYGPNKSFAAVELAAGASRRATTTRWTRPT